MITGGITHTFEHAPRRHGCRPQKQIRPRRSKPRVRPGSRGSIEYAARAFLANMYITMYVYPPFLRLRLRLPQRRSPLLSSPKYSASPTSPPNFPINQSLRSFFYDYDAWWIAVKLSLLPFPGKLWNAPYMRSWCKLLSFGL